MYKFYPIRELISNCKEAITKPIVRFGVGVYVESDPDICGNDIYIDPADLEGIKIFREFASKMAAHYKSLKIKP